MQDKLIQLIIRHCDTLQVEARAIGEAMAETDCARSADRGAVLAAAHKLKGSSGSLGFTEISALAHVLENLLRDTGTRALSPQEVNEIGSTHADLQDRIANIAPEQSSLYARLIK